MAQIGDLIPKAGIYTEPGVVVDRKADGTITVDTEPLSINKYHRYANTTGLTEAEKMKFNKILDTIYSKKDNDVDKINDIQAEIDKLKADPLNKNIVQYLRNQQSHLIRSAGDVPRIYSWSEAQLKI